MIITLYSSLTIKIQVFKNIEKLIEDCCSSFAQISAERKNNLLKITAFIQQKINEELPIQLNYICTHNSRRSHFGQIAAAVSANYFQINQVKTFSGGTEATAFNPNAINALKELGFEIYSNDKIENPTYKVFYDEQLFITCFSKVYNHASNPNSNFAAIMTCSDAEQNCPFISGAEFRIATTYEDPKKSDGTPLQNETYQNRFIQILTETLFVFSQLKNK